MSNERFEVSLTGDNVSYAGAIECWEEAPEPQYADHVKLVLTANDLRLEAWHSHSYFRALTQIREELEKRGLYLGCYGASENVYPSPMTENMGNGRKAYRLKHGKPAVLHDLVSIFDTGDDVVVSTVEAQETYHAKWLKSLPQKA